MGNTALLQADRLVFVLDNFLEVCAGICLYIHRYCMYVCMQDTYRSNWLSAELLHRPCALAGGASAGVLFGAAAQAAVALRAATVHRVHQHTVDLLAQLGHVWGHVAHLAAIRRQEHVLIQWTPGERGKRWCLLTR